MPLRIICCQASRSLNRSSAVWSAQRTAGASKSLNTMPVPRACRGIPLLHRVRETAGPAHDRHRAVFQAVHLIEPARLVQRRHQEHVARRFDQMRELLAVAAMEHDAIREALLQAGEETFVARFAAAEHDQVRSRVAMISGSVVEQQIEALLHGQARHHAEQRRGRVDRQVQPVEQRALGLRLARQILSANSDA